jgi:hypothetical protein
MSARTTAAVHLPRAIDYQDTKCHLRPFSKLRGATKAAFELDEVCPEEDCVRLDYRDYDGNAMSTKFWFDAQGSITRTLCAPIGRDGARSRAT